MGSWDEFSTALTTKLNEETTALALPEDLNKNRFVQNAIAFLKTANDNVLACGKTQIVNCLMQGAILGLDFMSKECYAVPYKGKLEFMKSPTGDIKLVKRYSKRPVREVEAKIVRDGDILDITYHNGQPSFTFSPKAFSKAPVIGAFAWVEYEDGGILLDVLDRSELDAAKNQSKAANSPSWRNFETEMFRKVAIHRVCKRVTIDFENYTQRELFDADTAIVADAKEMRDKDAVEEANAMPFGADA